MQAFVGLVPVHHCVALDDSDGDVASLASTEMACTQSMGSTRDSNDADSLPGSDCESVERKGSPRMLDGCSLDLGAPPCKPCTRIPAVMMPQLMAPYDIVAPQLDLCAVQKDVADMSCSGALIAPQHCEVAREHTKTKKRHVSSRRMLPVHPMPAASEEEWQVRIQKREAAIELVMKSQEYKSCLRAGCQPHAPDPSDRTMSKRQWEVRIIKFRDDVKLISKTLTPPPSNVNALSKSPRPRWADIVDDEGEHI